jgi:pimeloyl-ACP methyl ester carboxylesterase
MGQPFSALRQRLREQPERRAVQPHDHPRHRSRYGKPAPRSPQAADQLLRLSYGTYLAQVYATLHPDRVRRFVLDGVVGPRDWDYEGFFAQTRAFETAIQAYFDWLAKYREVYHVGATDEAVERRYYRTLDALDRNPRRGVLGSAELTDIFTIAGYGVYSWDVIADAYSQLVNKNNPRPLIDINNAINVTGPGADNGYAAFLGTLCTDIRFPDWEQVARDTRRLYQEAPFIAWGSAWFSAPCSFWPFEPQAPVTIDGDDVETPILMISETFDAATPFEGALDARAEFPTASLIEGVGGTTHSSSLSGVACVDNAVAAYLRHGTVPERKPGRRSDLRCSPLPAPDPTAAAAPRQELALWRRRRTRCTPGGP